MSQRLGVKGQNGAALREAADKKCHFNLGAAAAGSLCGATHRVVLRLQLEWMWKLLTLDRVLEHFSFQGSLYPWSGLSEINANKCSQTVLTICLVTQKVLKLYITYLQSLITRISVSLTDSTQHS